MKLEKLKVRSILTRHEANPILGPEDMPFDCYAVFNSGAVRFNGKILMLLRVELCNMKCNFYTATSDDGVKFTVHPEPVDYPFREVEVNHKTHRFDARITEMDGLFYIYHAVWTNFGSSIALATTKDFVRFTPFPHISVPSNRNAVLFPQKFGDLYARLERPQNIDGSGGIWISYSPDLEFWGRSEPVAVPTFLWSRRKVGAGAVPIRTPHGWLEIYHGTNMTASTENYYLGVVLLDLEDPSKVIGAPSEFILAAEQEYECQGQVPNVVFTCGAVEHEGKLNIYYGGADTRMCLVQSTVDDLVNFCLQAKE